MRPEFFLDYRAFFLYGILLTEWVMHERSPRRERFSARAAMGVAAFLAFGVLSPLSMIGAAAGSTVYFCLSVLLFQALYRHSIKVTLALCATGYLLQNTALNIYKIAESFIPGWPARAAAHLLCLSAIALAGHCLVVRRLELDRLIEEAGEGSRWILLLPVTSIFVIVTLNTLFGENGLDDNIFCRIALVVSAGFALGMEYSQFKQDRLCVENQIIRQLLAAERSQYYISKETIDLLNMKHHDLKHQLGAIRRLCQQGQQDALKQIEDAIGIYDAVAKTGNEALDAVLTQKMLFCEKHGILLSYMVDENSLSFLDTVDLYALFGNILDNAIESVMREDEDKRVITLQVRQNSGFLTVHMENYCKSPPDFRGGLPQTTKKDRQNHGFGVKSICYLVQRYHGHTLFQARRGMFLLDIAIPIPA